MLAINQQMAPSPPNATHTTYAIKANWFFFTPSLGAIHCAREALTFVCLLMAFEVILPCGRADAQVPSSPEEAIKSYLAIPTSRWQERLPYVSDSEEAKAHMASVYASSPSTTAPDHVVVKGARKDATFARVGDTAGLETTFVYDGQPQKAVCYVTRDTDGFRVNWMRSVLPWLKADTPEGVAYRYAVGRLTADRVLPLCANPDLIRPTVEAFYSQKQVGGYTEDDVVRVMFHKDDIDKFLADDPRPFRLLIQTRGNSEFADLVWVIKTANGYKIDWLKTNEHDLVKMGAITAGNEAPRRAAPKQAEVVIDSTRKMIAFDEENPADYVGATLRIEPTVGWIDPISVHRDRSLKGYTFRWKCGENFEGAEEFGAAGLRRDGLNYVADTELGLSILDKLQKGTSYRIGMTFAIEEQMVDGRRIMVAKLKGIVPGKNSARDRARGQAVIDEILRGH